VAVITARPGRIKQIVDIPLPIPRYAEEDIRSSAAFTEIRHELWKLLSAEVTKTGASQSGGFGGELRTAKITVDESAKELVRPLHPAVSERGGLV
jgi:hypothetical protein